LICGTHKKASEIKVCERFLRYLILGCRVCRELKSGGLVDKTPIGVHVTTLVPVMKMGSVEDGQHTHTYTHIGTHTPANFILDVYIQALPLEQLLNHFHLHGFK
jgi:hypothetical protein